jgi:FAD/FMN-containing dehydrogenase
MSGWTGPVFLPDDPGYADELRTFNHTVEHRPKLIVGAAAASDVVGAVTYAAIHGLSVAVQATGHGMSLPSDGVMVTTRRLNRVDVDPVARTARLGPGARWLDVIPAAAAHGLAPLNGSSPQVGVMGFILGGGIGMLGRQHGYAADHVRWIEIVTADGTIRRTSANEDPELFFALRGGKGNFGIVTDVEIDLFPVTRLYGGGLYFSGEATAELLDQYVRWTRRVPDTMATSILLVRLPAIDAVQPELRGRYVAHLRVAFFGERDDAEALLEPIRDIGHVLHGTIREMAYTEIGAIHQDPVGPYEVYESGFYTSHLDETDAAKLLELAGPNASAPFILELRHHGGGYRQSPTIPNCVGGRDAEFTVYLGSLIDPPSLSEDRRVHDAVRQSFQRVDRGTVLNFLGARVSAGMIRNAYSEDVYERLSRLKTRYDPSNLFRINHNLAAPAESVSSTERRVCQEHSS